MRISNTKDEIVISYMTFRKAIGWLGVLLPFVLVIGTLLLGSCSGIQYSISHYYYTIMGDVFVGTLCCLGLFLLTYRYEKMDNIASNIAGVFAICVAFFPTTDISTDCSFRCLTPLSTSLCHIRTIFYFISAAIFLVTLACISLFLFTKTNKSNPAPRKKVRNIIYIIWGVTMLVSVGAVALISFSPAMQSALARYHYIFWGECLALWAFGISWLIKGEVLLAD